MRLSSSRDSIRGFSLAEILIVVVIIGILATVAIPYLNRVRESAQNSRLMNDWRMFSGVFEQYALENGTFPSESGRGEVPGGMEGILGETHWVETTAVGGNWDWDFEVFGVEAGISLVDSIVTPSQMLDVDDRVDDGDLSTGLFRRVTATRFTLVLDFSSGS